MFRAILFDLDDTLIENDMQSFLDAYFKSLAPRIQPYCKNVNFIDAIYKSSRPLFKMKNSNTVLIDVFYNELKNYTGLEPDEMHKLFLEYYDNEYRSIDVIKPVPGAIDCLHKAAEIAEKIVVATVPIFPKIAINIRLEKGGITDFDFDLITGIDEMHSSKPHKSYFDEILKKINCKPGECLMIGNDHIDDLAAQKAGIRTFLVTNFQKNKGKSKFKPDREGSMDDLLTYLSLLA